MTSHAVVAASVLHMKPLARGMRTAAYLTVSDAGYDPRLALRRTMGQSHHCRTALIDGVPVAMWGVVGALLAESAYVWLIMADDITNMPLTIVREAKTQLAEIMIHYEEVAITIMPDDDAALRFATYLGFHDRHHGDDARSRKQIERDIRENPENRVSIGESYVIALGYHPGAR